MNNQVAMYGLLNNAREGTLKIKSFHESINLVFTNMTKYGFLLREPIRFHGTD